MSDFTEYLLHSPGISVVLIYVASSVAGLVGCFVHSRYEGQY